MAYLPSDISVFTGPLPGPTSAVLAGVHGDERAGLQAFTELCPGLRVERGTVFFVLANPEAITRQVRYVEENLNRCFIPGRTGDSYEARRADELMPVFDRVDALLDLHATHSVHPIPFLIADGPGIGLAKKLSFSIVSTGWNTLEYGGTDSYMFGRGKIGICAECGSIADPAGGSQMALRVIGDFLRLRGHVAGSVAPPTPKRFVHVTEKYTKRTIDFRFAKEFVDFEPLPSGQAFAWDGNLTYIAKPGQCIVFPRSNKPVGDEVFILGEQVMS